jgi:hypothetical protein
VDEFVEEKKKILMKFEEVENCTFAPTVRSKLPEKYKGKAKDDDILFGKTAKNFDVKLKEIEASQGYYQAKKKGCLQKAIRKYKEGNSTEAYKLVSQSFNINSLRDHFGDKKKDKEPEKGTPLYRILHEKKQMTKEEQLKNEANQKDAEINKEVFGDKVYSNFLRDVFDFVRIIESHQEELIKQLKQSKQALKRTKSTDAKLKGEMCPLGQHCPDYLNNRWPISTKKGTEPIGKDCPFAHHPFHLQSTQFLRTNKSLKKDLIKRLENEVKGIGQSNVEKDPWNPAGNPLCVPDRYANIRDSRDEFMKYNQTKLEEFTRKSLEHNVKLKNSAKVKNRIKDMKLEDDNYRKKVGHLKRATLLYEKRRFKEAFEVIIKAIRIVKEEEEDEEVEHQAYVKKLKERLELDIDVELNQEVLVKMQEHIKKPKKDEDEEDRRGAKEKENPLEELEGEKFQKLVYFAEKIGAIGERDIGVNQDLKNEIEDL